MFSFIFSVVVGKMNELKEVRKLHRADDVCRVNEKS